MKNAGYKITTNIETAEIIIINTCGFINSAKSEAIDTILNVADYKKYGKCKHLIVIGCLAKRYKEDIQREFKEVDLVIGIDEYINFDSIFSRYIKSDRLNKGLEFKNRIISSTFPTAYIRISDGCNNCCNYCAIPLIRGHLKSRTIEDILEEARNLVRQGIQELVVISQDTTSYGVDIYGSCKLIELLRQLSKIDGLKWVRLLYMYPGKITEELIQEFLNNNKLCRYFDIPIQHVSDNMLKAMNRHTNKKEIYNLVKKIREKMPDAIIRTTVMVGYQGETIKDFNELIQGLEALKFDRLGAFKFSKEQDTVANNISGDILESVKQKRYNILMKQQQIIIFEKMKSMIGQEVEVLVENISEDNKYFLCRSYMESPDIDSKILLAINKNTASVIIGSFMPVIITGNINYDYICKLKEDK